MRPAKPYSRAEPRTAEATRRTSGPGREVGPVYVGGVFPLVDRSGSKSV